MRRPPWFVRICAPLASLAGSLCRFFALDVGPPGRIETGGLIVEPNVSLLGQPIATVRAASTRPSIRPASGSSP
jgi:hypothetical protein